MNTLEVKSPQGAGQEKGKGIKVCIVEDDERARNIFAEWLSQAEGLELINQFGDAESAIAELPRYAPDVALVDINLPGLSGIDCVRKLKPELPNTQFVMLTVYEDSDRIFEALAAGAAGYLLKQTPREELLDAVKSVHQGSSPMSGSIARKVVQSFQRPVASVPATAQLSTRENEVLDLLSRGFLYKEIAAILGVSYATVTTYGRRIYEKLHVHSRAQVAALFGKSSDRPRR